MYGKPTLQGKDGTRHLVPMRASALVQGYIEDQERSRAKQKLQENGKRNT